MPMAKHQNLYELQKKVGLIKGKKTPEGGRAFEARMVMLETKTDSSRDESLLPDDRRGSRTRQCHADT